MDLYYIVKSDTGDAIASSDDILETFCDQTDIDSDINTNVSVKNFTIVRNETAGSSNDLSQNDRMQLVGIKTYFMSKIFQELKKEINGLKQ